MTDDEWKKIRDRLSRSRFRAGIVLNKKDEDYYRAKREREIKTHARDFIVSRLSPAEPANDGKQTPWRGHPVFTAQHATATCCRKCLEKWHKIPRSRELTNLEIEHLTDLIAKWLEEKIRIL